MLFFTADQHFYHEGIIEICKRPYKNSNEMEKNLISNYNSVVGLDDEVYFLGDLTFLKNRNIIKSLLSKLNGQKHLILGNHDYLNPFGYVECGFLTVHTCLIIDTEIGKIGLTHDPAITNVNTNIPWLCGHVHNLFTSIGSVVNVGVDVCDYCPISIDQINIILHQSLGRINHE
jgi:calcineurin-like phosphoesterase family protein